MGVPVSDDPTIRVGVLQKKIGALESLAANASTTAAESESAQRTANKLRLELAKRLREGATQKAGQPASAPAASSVEKSEQPEARQSAERAPESAPSSHPEAPLGPLVTRARRRRRKSPRAASTWLGRLALVASLGALAVSLAIPLTGLSPESSSEPGAPAPRGGDERAPAAPLQPPGAELETDRARAAERMFSSIAREHGNKAAAESMRACEMRRLTREFEATAGAKALPGEGAVDVRRRCATYLKVRGVNHAMCFPPTDANPHPTCPLPE